MDDFEINISGIRPPAAQPASRSDRRERGGHRRNAWAPRAERQSSKHKAEDAGGPRKRALEESGSRMQLTKPVKKAKRSMEQGSVQRNSGAGALARRAEPLETPAPKEPQGISQRFTVPKQSMRSLNREKAKALKKEKMLKRRKAIATPADAAQAPAQPQKAKMKKKKGESKAALDGERANRGGIPSNSDFKKLRLHESINRQLDFLKFSQCTPVQALAVPAALDGTRDVLVRAATGSGKTLAFLLPVLHQLLQLAPELRERQKGTLSLVLSPTKELALQTLKVAQDLLRMVPSVVCGAVAGGEKPKSEKARLRKGLTVLCATPGRLAYHMENSGSFVISQLRHLVLDEADRLLDLGFEPQIRRIYKMIKEARANHDMAQEVIGRKPADYVLQSLLVSATLSPDVNRLANFSLRKDAFWADPDTSTANGERPEKEPESGLAFSVPSTLTQWYCVVPTKERLVALISAIISRTSGSAGSDARKAIVFFSANSSVDFHHDIFKDVDWPSIHGFEGPKESSGRRTVRKLKDGFVGINPDQEDEEEEDDEDDDQEDEEEEEQEGKGANANEETPKIFADTPLFKLHGNLDKEERSGYIHDFTHADGGVLLASDAASRGLDFPRIDWIIQYDPPQRIEEYLHRIGRTARIGRSGNSLLFLQPSERGFLDVLKEKGVTNLKEINPASLPSALLRAGAPAELSRSREFGQLLAGHLASRVASQPELLKLARSALLSALRSYRSFPWELRSVFPFQELHIGHFASSFALREAPVQASRQHRRSSGKGAGKGGKDKGKGGHGQPSHEASGRKRRKGGPSDEFAS